MPSTSIDPTLRVTLALSTATDLVRTRHYEAGCRRINHRLSLQQGGDGDGEALLRLLTGGDLPEHIRDEVRDALWADFSGPQHRALMAVAEHFGIDWERDEDRVIDEPGWPASEV